MAYTATSCASLRAFASRRLPSQVSLPPCSALGTRFDIAQLECASSQDTWHTQSCRPLPNGVTCRETHLYASALMAFSEACAACSPLQSEQSSLWACIWGRPHYLDGRYRPIILREPPIHCDRLVALPQLSFAHCLYCGPMQIPYGSHTCTSIAQLHSTVPSHSRLVEFPCGSAWE